VNPLASVVSQLSLYTCVISSECEKSCIVYRLSRSFPEFTLSHSTLLMALSEVEGPVEGVEMTSDGRDTTLGR
jgi:hypothetical protein